MREKKSCSQKYTINYLVYIFLICIHLTFDIYFKG